MERVLKLGINLKDFMWVGCEIVLMAELICETNKLSWTKFYLHRLISAVFEMGGGGSCETG